MSFLRFGLIALVLIRIPFILARLRRQFSGEPLQAGEHRVSFKVRRSRKRRTIDRVEIALPVTDKTRFCIRPETMFDQLCKSIGLATEWQTHDTDFDRDVFLLCEDEVFLRVLRANEALRDAVRELVGNLHGGTLRSSNGWLWVEMSYSGDSDSQDAQIAREVADRVLPALLNIRTHLEQIVASQWRDERDVGISRETILLGITLTAGALGLIALFFDDSIKPPRQLLVNSIDHLALWIAAITTSVLASSAFLWLRATSRLHWVLLDVLIVGAPGLYLLAHASIVHLNQSRDKSAGDVHYVEVQDKQAVRGRKGRVTYYITVAGWPDPRAEHRVKVDRNLFDSLDPAGQAYACVRIRWHRGAFHDPWVSEMVASHRCTSE